MLCRHVNLFKMEAGISETRALFTKSLEVSSAQVELVSDGLTEREIFIDNLLVRVHLIIEMSRPALRHGSYNSLFQVALYLPS